MQVTITVAGATGAAAFVSALVWVLFRTARSVVRLFAWKIWDLAARRSGASKAQRRALLLEAARADLVRAPKAGR